MAATVSSGRQYGRRICSIFRLLMESKALATSTNNIVACRFLRVHLQEFEFGCVLVV